MPNAYIFQGKDGKTRRFVGDRPPTPEEMAAVEGATAQHPDPAPHWGMYPTREQEALTAPEPDWKSNLAGAMEPLAHPKTAGDLGNLLIPGGAGSVTEGVLKAAGKLPLAKIGMGAAGAAYGGATAPENATPLGTLGRMATYGAAGAMAPTAVKLLPAPAREAAEQLATKVGEWNSPLTVAGREGRAQAAVASQVDRYLPNKGGMPTSAAPTLSAGRVPYATPTEATGGPHLDLSRPVQAGNLTQDQIAERLAAVKQQGGLPPQPPVTPKAPLVSAGDKAMLARQGYSPEMLPPSPAPRVPAPLPASPPMGSSQPLPLYPSVGTVKGVTSNALETASNVALAAGHWDEAERLIGQSLQSFFQGSGGPMVGIMAAAIAHKARQVVEPLRADPAFQRAAPAKQQQMIQQALRQPGARGSLTNALGN